MSFAQKLWSCGRFIPGHSWIHALDPRAKLIACSALIIALLIAQSPLQFVLCANIIALCYVTSSLPASTLYSSSTPLILLTCLVFVLNLLSTHFGSPLLTFWVFSIYDKSLALACLIAARVGLIALITNLFALTTPPLSIARACESLAFPLTRFGVPTVALSMMLSLTLRFIPQLGEELLNIHNAQKCRGATSTRNPVQTLRQLQLLVIPLFASMLRRSMTLSAALDARCFTTHTPHGHLEVLCYTSRDKQVITCAVLVVMSVAVLRFVL